MWERPTPPLPTICCSCELSKHYIKKIQKLAIGMEMFPSSSQPALDRYTLSGEEVDERTFLKESDYYNVWRFDYRFFQDILHFARKNHIPVIGLNLDRQIVSEVFRSGGTDSLTKRCRNRCPKTGIWTCKATVNDFLLCTKSICRAITAAVRKAALFKPREYGTRPWRKILPIF